MNQYDMTLIAIAEKQVKIQAVIVEDAAKVVEDLYTKQIFWTLEMVM